MFIFIILSLFSAWIWVDATEEINMGLDFYFYDLYGGGGTEDVVFLDLDGDDDDDMVRVIVTNTEIILKASENVSTQAHTMWEDSPDLLSGVDYQDFFSDRFSSRVSLAAADLNGDSKEELILGREGYSLAYLDQGEVGKPMWQADSSLLGELAPDRMPCEPDFADIDQDGDLDMVGIWVVNWDESGMCLWWNQGTSRRPQWKMDTTYFGYDPWEGRFCENPSWIDWDDDGVYDVIHTSWFFADPLPYVGVIYVKNNVGSPVSPEWDNEWIYDGYVLGYLTLFDWNSDEVPDIFMQGDCYDGGYHYVPGTRSDSGGISYDFYHPRIWGGIAGTYPAAADVNDDDIPELAVTEQNYHMGLEGGSMIVSYYFLHLRKYSLLEEESNTWREDAHGCFYDIISYYTDGHMQYVDFGNDGLMDYVINVVSGEDKSLGKHYLYRNKGSRENPDWWWDTTALKELPVLFPSCFLDADGDRDKDLIGFSVKDSNLVGFLNVGSDRDPSYMKYDVIISGLEGISPTYFAAGDITDNDLDLPDLAIGIKDGGLTAYFNSGQDNPRWHKHEEVFKGLGINGNPCLCDADSDGDLDLYLVTGRLHYYRNESTGGVAESVSGVTASYIGRELQIQLSLGTAGEAFLTLYNVAGQRVEERSAKPKDGLIRFRISERPGVYFYRVVVGGDDFSGKIVIF